MLFGMMTLFLGVGLALVAGYHRLSVRFWLPLLAFWLVASAAFELMHGFLVMFLAVLLALLGVMLLHASSRQRWLIRPLWAYFKRRLPALSPTEQEALVAGGTYWEAELMHGMPDGEKLFNLAPGQLTAAEQTFLTQQTETLCTLLDEWDILRTRDLSQPVWDYIRQERFWGLVIPTEYGGLGFSTLAHSQIVTKIATCSPSAAVTVMVPNSLGPAELLLKYGTDEQKNYYLPKLARGEEVPCFGLTELMAGSDASMLEAAGVLCYGQHAGQSVLGIRLSWEKRYITLAPIATVIGIAFKLTDPTNLLGKGHDLGITLGLIPAKHPGVRVGERHLPLMLGFMNGPIYGEDVFIPLDWVIGGTAGIGQGWGMLMECLASGRGISLPAMAAATMQVAYRMSGAYAALRRQFNLPLGAFPGVQEVLGRIGGMTYLVEATRLFTVTGIDQGLHSATASAITKYYLTEFSRQAINDAMDIHGGRGIILGPRNYLAFSHLSNPVGITVEGANILTRNLMIFGQGAIRCHPYILAEMQATSMLDPQQALITFDKWVMQHLGYTVSNLARLSISQVVAGWYRHQRHPDPVKKYLAQLKRMSLVLAVITDLMFVLLGGELKRAERISARLADVLGYLYMCSAVLHYFTVKKCPANDLPYLVWCLENNLHIVQTALIELANNFPRACFRGLIRRLCFPAGLPYKPPTDAVTAQIALSMQEASDIREQLTRAMYVSVDPHNAVGRVEHAFLLMLAAKPALKKIHTAVKAQQIAGNIGLTEQFSVAFAQKIIDASELELLQNYYAAYRDALAVDTFTAAEVTAWSK